MMKRAMSVVLLAVIAVAAVNAAEDTPQAVVKNPELKQQLLDRRKADQDARSVIQKWMMQHATNGVVNTDTLKPDLKAEFEKAAGNVKKVDGANTTWLKGMVEKNGWPTKSMVGEEGQHAAWVLVQHADSDPKLQRQCVDLMTKLPKEEVVAQDFAFLTDRVLVAEGKKQKFGTQFTSVNGKVQPKPIEDEANVDQRRTDLGLMSLADYTKFMEQQFHGGGGAK